MGIFSTIKKTFIKTDDEMEQEKSRRIEPKKYKMPEKEKYERMKFGGKSSMTFEQYQDFKKLEKKYEKKEKKEDKHPKKEKTKDRGIVWNLSQKAHDYQKMDIDFVGMPSNGGGAYDMSGLMGNKKRRR